MSLDKKSRSKKGRIAFTAFALFLFSTLQISAPKAHAAPGSHSVGLGLGQVLLMGDFDKYFSNSLGFSLLYGYEASQLFGLLVSISMSNHSGEAEAGSGSGGTSTTDELSIKSLTPNLRVNLAYIDKMVVYAFGGFGMYMVNERLATQQGSIITLGLDVGAAVNLELNPHFQFGTSLGFYNIFSKSDSSTASSTQAGLTIGGTYLSLGLNAFYTF